MHFQTHCRSHLVMIVMHYTIYNINLHQTTCQIVQFIQQSHLDCGHEILKTTIASINICPTFKNCKTTTKRIIKVTKQFVFCLHCCCCLSVNGKE